MSSSDEEYASVSQLAFPTLSMCTTIENLKMVVLHNDHQDGTKMWLTTVASAERLLERWSAARHFSTGKGRYTLA